MKILGLDLEDKSQFETAFEPDHYILFKKHVDALAQAFVDQGETFWLRFMISHRDFTYSYGIVYKFMEEMSDKEDVPCRHNFESLGDEVYITIHNELLTRLTAGKIKTFMNDLYVIAMKRMSYGTSIVNNPYNQADSRDTFRRLLGHSQQMPESMKAFYVSTFAIPILMTFGGGICEIFRRWLKMKQSDSDVNTKINEKWQVPGEWRKRSFTPNKFDHYLSRVYRETLSEKLQIKNSIPMNGYKILLQSLNGGTLFRDDLPDFTKCTCDKIGGKQLNAPDQFSIEEILEVCTKAAMRNIPNADPDAKEEMRRRILLDLAEKEFKKEYNEDVSDGSELDESETKKKKKRKKIKRRQVKDTQDPSVVNGKKESSKTVKGNKDGEMKACIDTIKNLDLNGAATNYNGASSSQGQNIRGIKDGRRPILDKLDNNLTRIERCIHETGSLDSEHFNLVVQTSKLWEQSAKSLDHSLETHPNSTQQSKCEVKKCAGCLKEKRGEVKLKKCALCKEQNVTDPRYYCSRACQVHDWMEVHRSEHETGKLVKGK